MSELKAHSIIGLDDRCNSVDNVYYLKSEADKVIARLESDIAIKDNLNKLCLNALRHHKRKRCLAMVMWCWAIKEFNRYGDQDYADFAEKWRKRWLELAEEPTWEKFLQLIHKEAK